nr:MAG TPA: hypothetical protein [Caudoviricetes sp.]
MGCGPYVLFCTLRYPPLTYVESLFGLDTILTLSKGGLCGKGYK